MKTSRGRIDVNVEELDRVIDRAYRSTAALPLFPISEAVVESNLRHEQWPVSGQILQPRKIGLQSFPRFKIPDPAYQYFQPCY